jgi:hypothetical protein
MLTENCGRARYVDCFEGTCGIRWRGCRVACRSTESRKVRGRPTAIRLRRFDLRYNDRRKFKISCFCDGLRALKLAITPLASDPQNCVCEFGW